MTLNQINPADLLIRPHHLFDRQSLLLACGDFEADHFNAMTIGWGSIGTMWGKPFAQIVVRPSRFTYEFLEAYDDFTLTAFPAEFRRDLGYLGGHSGRDGDKIAATKLTPTLASQVLSPTFAQAELSIECLKIYYTDFDPNNFLDADIQRQYPLRDYHRVYYGEIVATWGAEKYTAHASISGSEG